MIDAMKNSLLNTQLVVWSAAKQSTRPYFVSTIEIDASATKKFTYPSHSRPVLRSESVLKQAEDNLITV